MKKKIIILLIVCFTFILTGCSDDKTPTIDEMKIQNICNLATLKVDYNNVARYTKEKTGLLKGELKAWVEYKGFVKLGVKMSKVKTSLENNVVTITMPMAEVLEYDIDSDSYTNDSWIFSEKEFWNINKIEPGELDKEVEKAQQNMVEVASSDSTLLLQAQNRAKLLIENYIKQIGKIANVEYTIKWIDIE